MEFQFESYDHAINSKVKKVRWLENKIEHLNALKNEYEGRIAEAICEIRYLEVARDSDSPELPNELVR